MKCGKNCLTFLYLITIIAIVNINILPIVCFDVAVDKNHNNDISSEQEYRYLHHYPITFPYGNSEKYPWRQKPYNTIESERFPSSTIVGLQQSNEGYNSWKKENHYTHENENHKENEMAKLNEDQESNEIYGFENEPNKIVEIRNKKRNNGSNGPKFMNNKEAHSPLCEIETEEFSLNTDTHIYHPNYYIEKKCKYPSSNRIENKHCSAAGFDCVTRNATLYLTRKSRKSDCWETVSFTVLSGCDCMWPVHRLDDKKNYK